MVINIPRFSIGRPSKIYTNWDFWFENKPSGNPDRHRKKQTNGFPLVTRMNGIAKYPNGILPSEVSQVALSTNCLLFSDRVSLFSHMS
jgi:hypothetical protein